MHYPRVTSLQSHFLYGFASLFPPLYIFYDYRVAFWEHKNSRINIGEHLFQRDFCYDGNTILKSDRK